MNPFINPYIELSAEVTPGGSHRNLLAGCAIAFLDPIPSDGKFVDGLFRAGAESGDLGHFLKMSQPVPVLIEEKLDSVTVKSIAHAPLSHLRYPLGRTARETVEPDSLSLSVPMVEKELCGHRATSKFDG